MRSKLFIIALFSATILMGQEEHLKYNLIDNTDPGRWIFISPDEPPGVRGNNYLFDEWLSANLALNNGSLHECFLNYDIQEQNLEVLTQEGVKVVPVTLVDSFLCIDQAGNRQVFWPRHKLDLVCILSQLNYLQLLFDGDKVRLWSGFEIIKKDPFYNEKLDVGDNNVKLIEQEHLFAEREGKCILLAGSAKKRVKTLNQFLRSSRIDKLVKDHGLNLKKTEDLVQLLHIMKM